MGRRHCSTGRRGGPRAVFLASKGRKRPVGRCNPNAAEWNLARKAAASPPHSKTPTDRAPPVFTLIRNPQSLDPNLFFPPLHFLHEPLHPVRLLADLCHEGIVLRRAGDGRHFPVVVERGAAEGVFVVFLPGEVDLVADVFLDADGFLQGGGPQVDVVSVSLS